MDGDSSAFVEYRPSMGLCKAYASAVSPFAPDQHLPTPGSYWCSPQPLPHLKRRWGSIYSIYFITRYA